MIASNCLQLASHLLPFLCDPVLWALIWQTKGTRNATGSSTFTRKRKLSVKNNCKRWVGEMLTNWYIMRLPGSWREIILWKLCFQINPIWILQKKKKNQTRYVYQGMILLCGHMWMDFYHDWTPTNLVFNSLLKGPILFFLSTNWYYHQSSERK